jgi:plasmid maintenance system antidote protein VapI
VHIFAGRLITIQMTDEKNNKKRQIIIGSLIKEKFKDSGLSISEFASLIACESRNIQKIFNKEHLSVDLLLKISEALKFDFFKIYSEYLLLEEKQSCSSDESHIRFEVSIPIEDAKKFYEYYRVNKKNEKK